MNQEHRMEKQRLRERYLSCRNELSTKEREEKSTKIMQELVKLPVFIHAKEILLYVNYRSEVHTIPLIQKLLSEGEKRVYVPRVEGMDIRFYEITSMEQLKSGYQGILEPMEGTKPFCVEADRMGECLMLLPGVVFDRNCNRMGYGKGFYDRYLSRERALYGIGLSFDCQIAPVLKKEEHDYQPDLVLTETMQYRNVKRRNGYE